ncbi:type III pantothenate kinase [Neomoorella thermoacetica]|uniref:Type III pantothenate kinase n=2 Tax=Neomoorella thermoacetica TaxID=1525 RepID=COAX_MOOTA|nr:type III pantothenate kinase [Moorella thermoacetica]Q2RM55.1 RecName: Full=Type III pantothenate kinase; AltName: Full=PanK-III; AltName: Full=Pantothenic acid kinase [Moorella thermoacetica ATCC 39073]AKX92975.1 type III pantothenate kinase [Moorella thermoacetica]AKX95528.1 type III pantothenate kinase [Moorella thermoacetica]AOQ22645.1 Type III pantothenate kinase [Moorella thermoacetica]APC07336.1 type III pantothenate kinase [Moorella thermoacetica]OIQ10331.1 type III pantothenate ki
MLLAIDVGNTNIVLGIFAGHELKCHWRVASDRQKTADEYGLILRQLAHYQGLDLKEIQGVVLASVVPTLTQVLTEMITKQLGHQPLVIGPGVKTGMPIRFENPREVGADRIVNGVAVYELYGGPAIVVDFGTATTFDAISEKGEYLGGAIAPGIGIATDALFARAAKLPRVELVRPPRLIGKNTVACMQAGIMYGFIGQVEGIITRMQAEMGGKAIVVATGGLAGLIGPEVNCIDRVDPMLTLEGLRIVYERNT